jgi:hypothetical protein
LLIRLRPISSFGVPDGYKRSDVKLKIFYVILNIFAVDMCHKIRDWEEIMKKVHNMRLRGTLWEQKSFKST